MKTYTLLFLLAITVILSGCSTIQSPSLTGEWEQKKDGKTQADLVFGPGDTFHANLAAADGVEVKGITHIEGSEIIFINESGTDATSSNPAPGTYMYSIKGDTLVFGKIEDPLVRRTKFLSQPWTRVDPEQK